MATHIPLLNKNFLLNLSTYQHCNAVKFVDLEKGFIEISLILIIWELYEFDVDKDYPIFHHLLTLYDCLLFR